jgi:hypothetical protein
MTTKPKTRKAPAAGDAVNPKLTACAGKLADAWRQWRKRSALAKSADDEGKADNAATAAIVEVCNLERKLARVPNTNLTELELKAKYANPELSRDALAESIIRDLRKLNRKRVAASGGNDEWDRQPQQCVCQTADEAPTCRTE